MMIATAQLRTLIVGSDEVGGNTADLRRCLEGLAITDSDRVSRESSMETLREYVSDREVDVVFVEGAEQASLDFINRIRDEGFNQPIIVLDTVGGGRSVAHAFQAGADDYLTREELKPDFVEVAIRRALERRVSGRDYARAEAVLRRKEESFRQLFESAPVGILVLSREGRILQANIVIMALLETVFGLERFPESITEREFFADMALVTNFRKCVQTRDLLTTEASVVGVDHHTRHLRYQFAPIFGEGHNEVHSVQVLIEDITQQKDAEEQLVESKRRLMEMLKHIKLLAVMLDVNGNIVFCNDFLLSLTGWKREDIIGANWYSRFVPGSGGKKKNLWELLAPDTLHYKSRIVTRSGEERQVYWNNTILKDRDNEINGIASIGEDISDRLRAEQEIRDLSHTIIQVQEEERSRISMEIHDEVGQTLFALKLKLQQLFSRMKDEELLAEKAGIIQMISFIANHIRQFSHNLSPIGLKNLGLPRAIANLVESYETHNNTGDLRISLRLGDLEDFFPDNWDINFYRIIQEALNNIVKHAQATDVEILAHNPGNRLLVRVKDNGRGMPLGENAEKKPARGIGLLIMRERANLMGANLNFRSQVGSGTEITIEIPRRHG